MRTPGGLKSALQQARATRAEDGGARNLFRPAHRSPRRGASSCRSGDRRCHCPGSGPWWWYPYASSSAGVPACEFTGRLARLSFRFRRPDAAKTRRRDGCAILCQLPCTTEPSAAARIQEPDARIPASAAACRLARAGGRHAGVRLPLASAIQSR